MKPIKETPLTIQRILRFTLLFVLLIGILWYASFQARNLLGGPRVLLDPEPSVVQQARTISLTGTTENITEITLNGRQISTNEEGRFEETLVLENGYTIMTLRARDRFGRSVSVSQPFVYTPASITD